MTNIDRAALRPSAEIRADLADGDAQLAMQHGGAAVYRLARDAEPMIDALDEAATQLAEARRVLAKAERWVANCVDPVEVGPDVKGSMLAELRAASSFLSPERECKRSDAHAWHVEFDGADVTPRRVHYCPGYPGTSQGGA